MRRQYEGLAEEVTSLTALVQRLRSNLQTAQDQSKAHWERIKWHATQYSTLSKAHDILKERHRGSRKIMLEQQKLDAMLSTQQEEPFDFSSEDLPKLDFSRHNLQGACFDGANLKGAKFCTTDLQDASMRSVILRKADLRGADLSKAALHNANCRDSDFRGASLAYANLTDTHMRSDDLRGVLFTGAVLKRTILTKANLRGAILIGATIEDCALPSPAMLLTAWWGDVSDELTTLLMRYDAANLPNGIDAFDAWANNAHTPSPYENSKFERSTNYNMLKECWSPGPALSAYQLAEMLLRNYCNYVA